MSKGSFQPVCEAMPLWKGVFLDRFAYNKKIIFFPKGSTSMIAVEHVGEAGVGAIEYGKDGAYYPVADENHTFNWMLDEMMIGAMGKKRKIINPAGWVCGLGAKSIINKDKKEGKEAGLNLQKVMKRSGTPPMKIFIATSAPRRCSITGMESL